MCLQPPIEPDPSLLHICVSSSQLSNFDDADVLPPISTITIMKRSGMLETHFELQKLLFRPLSTIASRSCSLDILV